MSGVRYQCIHYHVALADLQDVSKWKQLENHKKYCEKSKPKIWTFTFNVIYNISTKPVSIYFTI